MVPERTNWEQEVIQGREITIIKPAGTEESWRSTPWEGLRDGVNYTWRSYPRSEGAPAPTRHSLGVIEGGVSSLAFSACMRGQSGLLRLWTEAFRQREADIGSWKSSAHGMEMISDNL